MKRRDFIRATGALVAGTAVHRDLVASAAFSNDSAGARERVGRLVLPMNRNWLYSRTFVTGCEAIGFNASSWERVALPHSNVRVPWHNVDEQSYQFVSGYRRLFKLPPASRGRRIFVDFEGVMTAATVWLNGKLLGEYKGGYTPFSFELTQYADFSGTNALVVKVDSTERPDIPPFGDQLDYLTFGGIYREVSLRIVEPFFIENIFARPQNVLTESPGLQVDCHLQGTDAAQEPLLLEVELRDGDRLLAHASQDLAQLPTDRVSVHTLNLASLRDIKKWDIEQPKLYTVWVTLFRGNDLVDRDSRRIGFREARFTPNGFELNGQVLKLRGLNRHQTFPFAGAAMPARVQLRDAEILRKNFKCNIVRTSHYAQSRHFLDACDELGLLILEEMPGWQHIGDAQWKDLAVDNLSRMIRRDWNRPSIILWGARINESSDDHDFYTRTNALAHSLDPTRQTGGIRAFQESELLEDVFTMNDFGFPLQQPNHPFYLNTEFVGHTYNTKSIDNTDRLIEHTLRHARIHDQLASSPRYAGGIAWCAFDYNTHANFGSGDGICYHGVADIFREPKPAAGFYKSQCDPREEVVIELAFHWAPSDAAGGLNKVVVCSNCDHLKAYVAGKLVAEADPDRTSFPHLPHPPFVFNIAEKIDGNWGDLRLEGYVSGKLALVRQYAGGLKDIRFELVADETRLLADGRDSTRAVFRVTDAFGNARPFANDSISLGLDGPAEIIGDRDFSLVGGVGAVWIRASETPGTARMRAVHPQLGTREVTIDIASTPPELI